MSVRPVVDGIEVRYRQDLEVVRLNVQEPVGRDLAEQFGARYTPTFVLLDARGEQVWRSVFQIDEATVGRALGP